MPLTAFTNARLLDSASGRDEIGTVVTEGGKIAALGAGTAIPEVAQVIDCTGLCLAPGLVDMRVAVGEPGEEQRETILSASRAAAAGGITAFAMLPNTTPVIDDIAGLEFIARRAREAKLVKIFAYGAVTHGAAGKDLAEMGLLAEAGAVGFTDGVRAIGDALTMRRALSYAKAFDKVIVQHPEEPSLAAGGQMNEGEISTRLGLGGITRAAEIIMLERDLRLVALTGGALSRRASFDRRGSRTDPRGQASGAACHLRRRPTLFRADRGRYRRLPHLTPSCRPRCAPTATAAR